VVPVVVGLNYKTAEIKLRDANLSIRVLANRRDLALEPGLIVIQTPQAGERVDCGTVIGVTMSGDGFWKEQFSFLTKAPVISYPVQASTFGQQKTRPSKRKFRDLHKR
jgi:hypothetical protein